MTYSINRVWVSRIGLHLSDARFLWLNLSKWRNILTEILWYSGFRVLFFDLAIIFFFFSLWGETPCDFNDLNLSKMTFIEEILSFFDSFFFWASFCFCNCICMKLSFSSASCLPKLDQMKTNVFRATQFHQFAWLFYGFRLFYCRSQFFAFLLAKRATASSCLCRDQPMVNKKSLLF